MICFGRRDRNLILRCKYLGIIMSHRRIHFITDNGCLFNGEHEALLDRAPRAEGGRYERS